MCAEHHFIFVDIPWCPHGVACWFCSTAAVSDLFNYSTFKSMPSD